MAMWHPEQFNHLGSPVREFAARSLYRMQLVGDLRTALAFLSLHHDHCVRAQDALALDDLSRMSAYLLDFAGYIDPAVGNANALRNAGLEISPALVEFCEQENVGSLITPVVERMPKTFSWDGVDRENFLDRLRSWGRYKEEAFPVIGALAREYHRALTGRDRELGPRAMRPAMFKEHLTENSILAQMPCVPREMPSVDGESLTLQLEMLVGLRLIHRVFGGIKMSSVNRDEATATILSLLGKQAGDLPDYLADGDALTERLGWLVGPSRDATLVNDDLLLAMEVSEVIDMALPDANADALLPVALTVDNDAVATEVDSVSSATFEQILRELGVNVQDGRNDDARRDPTDRHGLDELRGTIDDRPCPDEASGPDDPLTPPEEGLSPM